MVLEAFYIRLAECIIGQRPGGVYVADFFTA
jgi:hypothetical protein